MTGRDGFRSVVFCALCNAPPGAACVPSCFNHPDTVGRLVATAALLEGALARQGAPPVGRLELLVRARRSLHLLADQVAT